MTAPPRLLAVHPVLGSSHVARSIRFFADLGFTLDFRDDNNEPRYACVIRDAVELHLQWSSFEGLSPVADRPVYRILVDDVDRLFASHGESAADRWPGARGGPYAAPGETPWGTREFHLRDPDGNGLQFYQPR